MDNEQRAATCPFCEQRVAVTMNDPSDPDEGHILPHANAPGDACPGAGIGVQYVNHRLLNQLAIGQALGATQDGSVS